MYIVYIYSRIFQRAEAAPLTALENLHDLLFETELMSQVLCHVCI